MINIGKEADAFASWPTRERLRALKRIIPRARVEEALARTGLDRAHCARLPGWFMIWFVIGLGLFCRDCYRQVFRWLQPFRKGATPGRTTLCEARKRLGIAPLRFLAEQVIQVQGKPTTPGAFYRGMRTMALDGFVVDLPDTPANARAFGRPGSGRAPGAFPQARVLALCETGSHVLWRSLIKPYSCGEVTMAHYLLRFLQEDMLLLWDRNFLSYQTVSEIRQRQANLLARIKKNLVFEPIRVLDDGSYLSKMYRSSSDRQKDRNGILVRIIEYTFDDPGRAGSGEPHRLLTTLLDEKLDPAETLIVLYHERWEEELTIDELKTHQRERPVLRSQTPGGVVQELYGLLLGHYVIRVLMQEAAVTQGIDPHRLSFTATLKILRCRLPECPASQRGLRRWYHNLVAEVAEEALEDRRNRINPRVIKRKMSNWKKKRPEHCNYPQPTKDFGAAIVMRR
jgi:Transposase DDE domain/Insertion element 4 transposase N-terminal